MKYDLLTAYAKCALFKGFFLIVRSNFFSFRFFCKLVFASLQLFYCELTFSLAMSKFGCRKRKGVRLLIRLVEIPIGLGNQRIFSRLPSFGKWAETPEKINEVVTKKNSAKATISLSHWMNDFQNSFVPPPPRPPYIEDQGEKKMSKALQLSIDFCLPLTKVLPF